MYMSHVRRAAELPFVLGISVPSFLARQFESTEPANVLLERALERGFDFLLAPRSVASAFVRAELAMRAVPGVAIQQYLRDCADPGARDLIWLGRERFAPEDSIVISIDGSACGRHDAAILRQKIYAARSLVKADENRHVLLEIEMTDFTEGVANEEDDVLESFIVSLGKRPPSVEFGARFQSNRKIDCEELHRILTLARELGYNGVSLAMPDPLGELPFIEEPFIRTMGVN